MSKTRPDPQTLAQQLLDAEVAFWLANLKGKKLEKLVRDELQIVVERLDEVTLDQAVAREKVKATARRYAVDMEIGGAIPELFGEIARVIFEFRASTSTTLGEVVPDQVATEFIEKIFEPDGMLAHVLDNLRNSDAFQQFLGDVVFTVLKGYLLEQNNLMKWNTVATGTRKVRQWLSSKAPELSDTLEERARQWLDSGVASSLAMVNEALDHDHYRETALNSALAFWDVARQWPLSQYRNYLSEQDLQEFMVMGYEFWLSFRDTDYLKACIDLGVDFFFDKYGPVSLRELLDDLGVSDDMIIGEIEQYAPDLAGLLTRLGLTEAFLRRHLGRFYASKPVLTILSA